MKYAIRYYSKTGNTKKLADAIASVLNIEAKDISNALEDDVDILFLGSSIYGAAIDPAIIKFFDTLDVNVSKIVSFGSSGTMQSPYNQISNLCHVHDIKLYKKQFHCPGAFVGMNANRPDSNDIKNLKSFVNEIISDM